MKQHKRLCKSPNVRESEGGEVEVVENGSGEGGGGECDGGEGDGGEVGDREGGGGEVGSAEGGDREGQEGVEREDDGDDMGDLILGELGAGSDHHYIIDGVEFVVNGNEFGGLSAAELAENAAELEM